MNKATEEPEVCKATPTSGRVAESLVLNHNTHSQAFSKRLLVGESSEKPLEIGRVFLFWPQWAVPSHGLPSIPPSVAPSPLLGRFNGAEGGGPEQWPGQGSRQGVRFPGQPPSPLTSPVFSKTEHSVTACPWALLPLCPDLASCLLPWVFPVPCRLLPSH